jgi:hypothetical protein
MALTPPAGSALTGGRARGGRNRKEIMMLRVHSLRLAGAAALLFAAAAPAYAVGETPQKPAEAPSDQASDTAAAPAETAKPQVARPEDRKVCRTIDASESRLAAKRVCMTAEQWKHSDF